MKAIRKLIDELMDEVCGAKKYALCYQKYKSEKPSWANKYMEMATDEIRHASYLHDIVLDMITVERETNEPPQFMLEMWDEKHNEYIEKVALVKTILAL